MKYDPFLYGKDQTEGVVAIEWKDNKAILFLESKYEKGYTREIDHNLYTLSDGRVDETSKNLAGNLRYNFATKHSSSSIAKQFRSKCRYQGYESWFPRTPEEGLLISKGVTFFKGLEPKDVSVMALDLETTTIDPNHPDAKILLISTCYRDSDTLEPKLFAIDDYPSEKLMILDFADYVRKKDPAMIIGYNILGFDFPYLEARRPGLRLGRNRSKIKFAEKTSEKRKDASQSYTFTPCHIWGRQVIDIQHIVIEHDLANGRLLPNYKLKEVMVFLGLEKEGRAHYDASKIKDNCHIPEEWEKIKAYCEDDSEDCITLMDHIWEPFFYYAQQIPMTFERITQSSSGAKVNNFMLRAYLQRGHSIPKGDKKEWYQGGISIGNPGIYKHIYKVDVKSMYPSIIIDNDVCVTHKDPLRIYPRMVKEFTEERLRNKALYLSTKEFRYESKQAAQKIYINSCYGYIGAPYCNWNSMEAADFVTSEGRKILQKGIDWAVAKGFTIVNVDTDSFSFTTGHKIDNFSELITELNSLYSDVIEWENDGYYPKGVVIKAKNYVFVNEDGSWLKKGNSLKATMKEPALKQLIEDILTLLLEGDIGGCIASYHSAVISSSGIKSRSEMEAWSSRKTVTKAILNPTATTQERILAALGEGGPYAEADKVQVFFETNEKVTLLENFNGVYEKDRLYEKIFKTIKSFDAILDLAQFPNYKLKRNKQQLEDLHIAIETMRDSPSRDNQTSDGAKQ